GELLPRLGGEGRPVVVLEPVGERLPRLGGDPGGGDALVSGQRAVPPGEVVVRGTPVRGAEQRLDRGKLVELGAEGVAVRPCRRVLVRVTGGAHPAGGPFDELGVA